MRNILFSLTTTLLLGGCYFDKEEILYGDQDCAVDTVSFDVDIMPIIQGKCASSGCHTQGGNGNGIFDNYASVKAKVDNGSLKIRVIDRQDMPSNGPLNLCEYNYIKKWLENGAPNN